MGEPHQSSKVRPIVNRIHPASGRFPHEFPARNCRSNSGRAAVILSLDSGLHLDNAAASRP